MLNGCGSLLFPSDSLYSALIMQLVHKKHNVVNLVSSNDDRSETSLNAQSDAVSADYMIKKRKYGSNIKSMKSLNGSKPIIRVSCGS